MARKQRVDSTADAVRIAQGLTRELQPPSHVPLDDCDWPFWESVVGEYARADWTEHQLEIAAMLARTMANMEEQQRLLRDEGFTVKTDRGTPVANPRASVAKGLAGDILAFRRSLSLHARAQGGEARDVSKRQRHAKGLERGLSDVDELLGPAQVN